MSEMSGEEFNALRAEEAKKEANKGTKKTSKKSTKVSKKKMPKKAVVSARDFIMNRSKEIVDVPIKGPDGTMKIRIKARLTKVEVKEHKKFLEMIQDPENVSEEIANESTAKFLAAITIDPDLDEKFWARDDIDTLIATELLTAFSNKATEVLSSVQKFRAVK